MRNILKVTMNFAECFELKKHDYFVDFDFFKYSNLYFDQFCGEWNRIKKMEVLSKFSNA